MNAAVFAAPIGAPCPSEASKDNSPRASSAASSGRDQATRPERRPFNVRRAAEPILPMHVRACSHQNGRYHMRWFVHTWKRDGSRVGRQRTPYRCGSWRCEGCSPHEAQVTFVRIRDAFSSLPPSECVFLVLTLDRYSVRVEDGTKERRRRDGTVAVVKRWKVVTRRWRDAGSIAEAYGALSGMTQRLLKRLRRLHASNGWRSFGSAWVGTVEAHADGWPHFNLVIHSPDWADALRREQTHVEGSPNARARLRGDVRRHVVEAGWGPVGTAEPARNRDALAGYITKLARHAERAWAEIAKLTQAPLSAPERMRRLRSGWHFLPPRRHDPTVTGTLVRHTMQLDGSWDVTSVQSCPEAMREPVVMAECHVIRAEEDRRSRGLPWEAPRVLAWVCPGDAGRWRPPP